MSEARNQRFEIDIDEIERQLRRSVEQPADPKPDPLAELARIVGQNDPFQGILSNPNAAARPAQRVDAANANQQPVYQPPVQHQPPVAPHQPHQAVHEFADPRTIAAPAHAAADPYGHANAEPAYQQPQHDRYDPVPDAYGAHDASQSEQEFQPLRRKPARGKLIAVMAALVVTVSAVAAGMSYRKSGGFLAGGAPPVIVADKSPLKVAPENPGGVEVPNQDRQIYAKAPPEGQSRVVDGREQPIDVRSATPPVAPRASERSAVSEALGDPRRVRTVSVNPDGSAYGPTSTGAVAAPTARAPDLIPTGAMPAPTPVQTVAVPARAPVAPAASASAPEALPPSTHQAVNVLPPARPNIGAKPAAEAPVRTAAVAPEATAPKPVAAKPKPAADAAKPQAVAARSDKPVAEKPAEKPAAGAKNFMVQIAVRPSEQEARSAWDQAQEKFGSSLDNKPARLTSAKVAGKTVHRVRLGPMSKPEADAMCGKLKAKGGACFVAQN